MPSNHLILCHPLLLLHLSQHQGLSSEWALHIRWSKYQSFSISPFNEYSGLIFFRIDWFDLLAVQGALKSPPSTTIWKHQFFNSQPSFWSNSHICIWLLENQSFDYMDLCHKVIYPFFNTLSRFIIAFLPRSKCLLISWLQSLSAVTLEPKKIKSVTVLTFAWELRQHWW